MADECNVRNSDDKVARERDKQNASLKITKLKRYKVGQALMEESIKEGTYFADLIKGEMYVFL